MGLRIVGTGMAAPRQYETAEEVARRANTTAAWVIEHAGVERRRVGAPDLDVAELGAEAARIALKGLPCPDLIVNASGTPRQALPDSSVFLQRALKMEGIACFSVHASCTSFLVALQTANSLLATGSYRRILICSADLASRARNWSEPESAALLGDGAAAVVVEHTDGPAGLLGFRMATWPSGAEMTEIRGGGLRCHPNDPRTRQADNLFHMNGKAVYREVRGRFLRLLNETLASNGLGIEDIDLVVPHQPSAGGLRVLERAGFPPDRIVNILSEYGNCCAASLPMALAVAVEEGRIAPGSTLLLVGTSLSGCGPAQVVTGWWKGKTRCVGDWPGSRGGFS